MRVLVAGGAGFLGSHLCDALLKNGDEVWCADDLSTGSASNVEHLQGNPDFVYQQADVSYVDFLEQARGWLPFERIYHLASPASPPAYRRMPVHTLMAGSRGTQNLLDLAHGDNARFLLASTSEVYGDPLVHPQPETYWGNVNPVGWRSCYDEAKRFAEALTVAYRSEGIVTDSRIARIFNSYGPRMALNDGRPVVTFIKAALQGDYLPVQGDGQQTRSFCYVDDTVRGLIYLMESDATGPVNIGRPGKVTIEELAREIIHLTGSESVIHFVPRVEDDPQDREPSIYRATTILDWVPRVGRREGLELTISWVKQKLMEEAELAS